MEDYEESIKQLTKDIAQLTVAKERKEAQLRALLREQKKNKYAKNSPILRDQAGVIIRKGDWVKATSTGKFNRSEGTVVNFKKWVTFEDRTGVKQVRAPNNILISKDGRKRARRTNCTRRGRKSEPSTEK